MTNSKNLLAELEHELVSTSKLLQLVPAEKLNWQPHPKAMTLGQLAHHVATIPGRYTNFADEGSTTEKTLIYHHAPENKKEILEAFEKSTTKAKEILNKVTQEWENKSWTLTKNNQVLFTLPCPLFIRLLVFNHLFHHRGELTTYLRTLYPDTFGIWS
jgi:uncharacterized damage-inducible protein DinB